MTRADILFYKKIFGNVLLVNLIPVLKFIAEMGIRLQADPGGK